MENFIFVLVLLVKSGDAGGLTMQEFNSKDSCEAAKAEIEQEFGKIIKTHTHAICVQK